MKLNLKKFDKKKITKIIWKSLILIVIFTLVGVGVYFALKNANFNELKNKLGDTFWFWLVIAIFQLIQVIFIPVSNQIITVPCALLFNDELWKVFLASWLSIWVATIVIYWIGRSGGKKLLNWILSDKDASDKCTEFLKRGWVYYPLGMLLPIPDDILTALAGVGKMNFWYVMGTSFFTRAVDVAISVWGWGYLTRYSWGWIIMVLGIVLLILATIIFYRIDKKRHKKTTA